MREIRTLRCDVEGTGNVAWSRYCDTRRRKSELTVNTNFDLNRRASPRPYLREAGGAIPSAYSPNATYQKSWKFLYPPPCTMRMRALTMIITKIRKLSHNAILCCLLATG